MNMNETKHTNRYFMQLVCIICFCLMSIVAMGQQSSLRDGYNDQKSQRYAHILCGGCSITTWILKFCHRQQLLEKHILEMLPDKCKWENVGIYICSSARDAQTIFLIAVGQLERDVAHLNDFVQTSKNDVLICFYKFNWTSTTNQDVSISDWEFSIW